MQLLCSHLFILPFVIDVSGMLKESFYTVHSTLLNNIIIILLLLFNFSVLIISGYQFDRLPKYTFSHLHFFPCFNWCKRMKVSVIYILPKRRYKALFLIYGRMLIAALVCFSGLFLYLFKGGDMGIWYRIIHIFPASETPSFCVVPKKKGCCAVIYVAKNDRSSLIVGGTNLDVLILKILCVSHCILLIS